MEKIKKFISLYSITIEPCEEGGYFASCPELQGCHAEGETYGEVIDIMRDLIAAHVDLRKRHQEPVPAVEVEADHINIHMPIPIGI